MKTLRLVGMALLAVLMCVNFASCSSDDNEPATNEEGVVTNEKKLVEMKMVDSLEEITWTFSYDTKNRLDIIKGIEIDTKYDDQNTFTRSLTWGDGIIYYKDGSDNITFILSNGLIISAESEDADADLTNATFAYNSSKQLFTFKDENDYGTNENNYTWENGKLTKITDEDGYVVQLSYDNKTCKGYFPLIAFGNDMVDDNELFAVHPELIGMRNNQLPNRIHIKSEDPEDSYEEIAELSYTFTNDGYIESCTMKVDEVWNGEVEDVVTFIYTFKWQ